MDGVVAAQVAELAAADAEAVLAPAADARRDSRPGGDLLGDALACRGCFAHGRMVQLQARLKSRGFRGQPPHTRGVVTSCSREGPAWPETLQNA